MSKLIRVIQDTGTITRPLTSAIDLEGPPNQYFTDDNKLNEYFIDDAQQDNYQWHDL